jgi:N-acetylmuramoyl-L-alanine amidase-like
MNLPCTGSPLTASLSPAEGEKAASRQQDQLRGLPSSMTRRELFRYVGLGALGFLVPHCGITRAAEALQEPLQQFKGHDVFKRIVGKAATQDWRRLAIGEVVGKVAMELRGTPWVGRTLEVSNDAEYCVVNLRGLDCFTFWEAALCLARMLKHGKSTPADLLAEVRFTRYRGGKQGDFTTRLHYTTDWYVDNEARGVVKLLTPDLPGAQPFTQKVGVMTQHPESYRQLAAHPELVPKIRAIEDTINARSLKYLPLNKLAAAEHLLQTGDIVGVCIAHPGIDIGHAGLCIKDEQGVVHFMDCASSKRSMKVTLEPQISTCLNWSSRLTGVMFARPLEIT